jgi:glycosyltransferase involved in cell wall biosynthesis
MAPGTKMVTIPNGVELEFFTVAEAVSSKTVVFTGTLDYQPNIEAALDLASEVLPRVRAAVPDVKARIVGRRPVQAIRDLAGPGLEVVPDVEDIRTYIQEAAVVAVPLKSGSGTRIKILEGMAMGKAVVSTRKGAEGLDVRDGYDILLRDDMPGFADAVAELLGSPEERQKVGRNARSTVEAGYGYEALALRLEAALLDLLQRK